MKLKFEAPKNKRIHYRFIGFATTEYKDNTWWYNYDSKRWEQNPEATKGGYTSHQPCKSVRAFRRKLKRAPLGMTFTLVSRWKGCDVFGIGSYKSVDIKRRLK